uniref:Paramyosin n=1 Tax=Kalanchoe fedtschenkoi TaxID=63787 RepID=A0A7N0T9U5_KALFE
MASGGDGDADAVLSDVEGEESVPVEIRSSVADEVSAEKYGALLAELDRERKAREAAEKGKSEIQVSFNRLKALAHEAIKKRDEAGRQRDEAVREKEEVLKAKEVVDGEVAEVRKIRDELLKQRDEAAKEFDEVVKARDALKSEIENSAHMLVTGIDKISGKVVSYKNFAAGGLPRSQKYTGLPAVAYGVIKRTNEIVEELLKQIDATTKSRNEARELVEQRNYEIAIEVSQLEATISQLREEVEKKTSFAEGLEKSLREKDLQISEVEKDMLEKIALAEKEGLEVKQLLRDYDDKLRNLESKMDAQRPLLVDQLSMISKLHDQIYDVIKIVDANKMDQSELSESLFLPQETDMEENIRASLAGMEYIYDLIKIAGDKTKYVIEDRNSEVKRLNETVSRLTKEKEDIGSLLRSALSKRMTSDPTSKASELFHAAENGLRDAGIDFQFQNILKAGKVSDSRCEKGESERDDEIISLATALENIVKASQLQIIELQHLVDELREESGFLKEHIEAQAKDLSQKKLRIEELEQKERVANENVEGLMTDISAAEEEINRWKMAAEQEAAAGKAVEQELLAQLNTVRQELEEAKQAVKESVAKLKFKEETAAAAMAARDAAEKSLKLADLRASRLRDRVEELTRQLEDLDTREDSRRNRSGPRYVCWPWEWLGLNIEGSRRVITQAPASNEMELSEPFL